MYRRYQLLPELIKIQRVVSNLHFGSPRGRYCSRIVRTLTSMDMRMTSPKRRFIPMKSVSEKTVNEEKEKWSNTTLNTKNESNDKNQENNHDANRFSAEEAMTQISVSPSTLSYTKGCTIPITSFLRIITPKDEIPNGIWPIFRILDENGVIRNPDNDGYRISSKKKYKVDTSNQMKAEAFYDDLFALREHLSLNYSWLNFDQNPLLKPATYPYPDTESTNTLIRAYTHMIRLRHMDTILQNIQRQGRISFYMTCHGEEATTIGAAAALDLDDVILAQYREAGALMWRGFTSQQFADQCFSNQGDLGKGRQMPIHYGSRALNYQTISSPLGTQLPQAVGAAYRLKLQKKANVSIVFFGDGCASSCDFHSACNFASTLKVPVIFLCRNNGYAISTPTTEQYAGDGIISRCRGYGMAGLRVDGNDLLAVCAAVQAAKEYALAHSSPVMIEAMTYRQGHHSTSDDSTRYRDHREVQTVTESMDPMVRLGAFLTNYGILDGDDSTRLSDSEKQKILQAIHIAETKGKPTLDNLFEDVYKEKPLHLQRQEQQLNEHIQAVK